MQISKARLILGSGSPRRQELFARFWGDSGFEVVLPEFDEVAFMDDWLKSNGNTENKELAVALAKNKIDAITKNLEGNFVAVAADTLVIWNNSILNKPENSISAKKMLIQLSGQKHEVVTGISLLASNGIKTRNWNDHVTTEVKFCELTDPLIDWYVSSNEPFDKAGAYGIQGLGSMFVESLNGCFYNVMGLPVNRLMTMLHEAAITSFDFDFIYGFLPWS